MRFVEEGYDFEDFTRYLRKNGLYRDQADLKHLRVMVAAKLLNLILWKKDGEVIGHAIWHESNPEEHRRGDPREKKDKAILKKLLGAKKDFVELHEVWLSEEHRGKGYGKKFFEFFEGFMKAKGYGQIIFYAFHPAAIAICRQRGYKEAYGVDETGPRGEKATCYVFYLSMKGAS